MTFHPPLPFAVSLAIALAVVAAWAFLAWRRREAWWSLLLRTLAMAAALLALANPSRFAPPAGGAGKANLTVLVDASASMKGRFAPAKEWLAAAEAQVPANLTVLDLEGRPFTAATAPEAAQSDLLAALRSANGADAVLLISDGRATAIPAGDWLAALPADLGGAPVFAAPVGDAKEAQMAPGAITLEAWAGADVAHPREAVDVWAQVSGAPGTLVRVEWRGFAEPLHGEAVIPACGVAVLTQSARVPAEARSLLKAQVAATAGEQTARFEWALAIAPTPARVLLLEGAPNLRTRDAARALAGDSRIRLTSVQDVGPRRLVQSGGVSVPSFPRALTGKELAEVDVLVLGRRTETFFPDALSRDALASFEARGGKVMRLGEMSDVSWHMGSSQPRQAADAILRLAFGDALPEQVPPLPKADPMARELADTRPNPAFLAAVCEATGGRLLANRDLAPLRAALAQRPVSGAQASRPLIPRIWLLLAVAACLGLEWFLRKREGRA